MIFDSFNSNCSSIAGVFLSDSTATPEVMAYGTGAMAIPSTCLYRPFAPIAF